MLERDDTLLEYALSPLQEGMLFQWRVDGHAGTDIEQIIADLKEPIEPARLAVAWQNAVASFSTLRTAFRWDGLARPLQRILPEATIDFVTEDLTTLSPESIDARIADYLKDDRKKGFDLGQAPAMRVHLFQIGAAHFRMVWTVHHILIDGRSFEVVLNHVFGSYDGVAVSHDDRPYREYIDWMESQDHSAAREFWRARLAGFHAPTSLPFDHAATAGHEQLGERRTKLDLAVTQQLRALAEREGLTLNTLLMSAWGLMLSRYSGEKDVLFGATKTTRRGTIPDADSVTGVFLATIPVRLNADPELTVLEWLHNVRNEWVALRGQEHLPLVEIRQASSVTTSRLFDALFVYEHYQFGTRLQSQGNTWQARTFDILEQSGFPLTLAAYGDDELAIRLEYDAARFRASTIEIMLGHLTTLLQRWASDPSGRVWESSMLSAFERHNVIEAWNETASPYPRDKHIHEQFVAQVARNANAPAVQCDGIQLTYGELDNCANAVAAQLIASGVQAGERVGLFIERSIAYVTASLAVLKVGGTYLPLEPTYPKDRLLYMMADADARTILVPSRLAEQLATHLAPVAAPPRVVVMPDIATMSAQQHSQISVSAATDSGAAVAYIMYTSGSSGPPKGVEVTHRGVVRLVCNTNYMAFDANDVMLGLATTMFDASTWEVWTALLNGGRIVLSPAGPIDIGKLAELVASEKVTTLLYSVALFQQVVDNGLQAYASVRRFLVGGDVAPVPHLQRAMAQLPECAFVNAYGPTENAVISCAFVLPRDSKLDDPLPIGTPISNSQAYVLDAFGTPAAIGVAGELYAGGDGVALGYVKRAELTSERFVRDPFSNEVGARLYRTGDGARWRADGTMEFLGRLDNQVKIRGYRIEPGEVEAALLAVSGVKAAAVTVRPDQFGQKRLLGYFVPKDASGITVASVRAELRTQLPDYMVPAIIMEMQDLPLNNSGKVDRAALPEPSSEMAAQNNPASNTARPVSRSQRQLAQIWEGLLDHRPIGIDDDFFEIGGHSLLAVRMMMDVEQQLGKKLSLATLLERPTIRHLARKVDTAILNEPEPSMVVLQPNGQERPFAFVHGDLTGGGWYCRRLAALVGTEIPMIVLPTFRPEIAGDAFTIEAMAARHLGELRKAQPHGPYRLGGFCAGGLIALEMARELKAAGEVVERVVMVDSVHPNAAGARLRPIIDRYAPLARSREQMTKRIAVLNRVKYYDERLQVVRAMRPTQLLRWATNTVRIRFGGKPSPASVGTSIAAVPNTPPAKPAPPPEREKLLFYSRAASAYVPRPFSGTVDLVFSSDPLDQLINPTAPIVPGAKPEVGSARIERAWGRILRNAQVHHVDGSHIGIIVEHLDDLGACLRKCLEGSATK